MTKDEHRARHKELHQMLDELMADFIEHTGRRLSNSTLLELMEWSHRQTIEPEDLQDKPHVGPAEKSMQDAITEAMRAVAAEHEKYVRAWIAETGLHPTECELVQTMTAEGMTVRVQVRPQPAGRSA